MASSIAETVVGSHMFKIEGFSANKDLGVGKSIRSSTFSVGGHSWYIECYPCGVDEESVGRVTLFLCLSVHVEQVEAKFCFLTLVDQNDDDDDGDLCNYYLKDYKHTYSAETSWRRGSDVIERAKLESLLRDDCFQIICDVHIVREFPVVPQPYLHQPHPSGMHRVPTFQVHRGLQDPSAHVAASAAGGSTTATISREDLTGSHVLTIDGYSNMKLHDCFYRNFVETEWFHVGGELWRIELHPSGYNDAANYLAVIINLFPNEELVDYPNEALKARVELTLLTLAREKIASTKFCYDLTGTNDNNCCCNFRFNMEPQSSFILWDSFHVKCDITIVKETTPVQPPDLLTSQVGTDVEFEVGGELFSAHKLVLATRSSAFMAEFFGPAGNGTSSTTTVTRVPINDMEPRVFKALLHFIYTDTLPEVPKDDKVGMAQGLLVAADRYAMERLKLICGDMLCNNVNDAYTAVGTLELAVKHGCHRLKEKCKELLKGHLAKKVTP